MSNLKNRTTPRNFVIVQLLVLLCLGVAPSFALVSQTTHHPRFTSCRLYNAADDDASVALTKKEILLNHLATTINADPDRVPCGLDCSESETREVVQLIMDCLISGDNQILFSGGQVKAKDILGEWDLLFTSSRTFAINKSLSGLGRSESESAKFSSLRQKITGSQYLGFIEFVERLGGAGEDEGLDVVVSGEWMLEPGMDSFTGAPITSIRADLVKVVYGPSQNKADDWSSLGPVKLLDVVYLDDSLQILRSKVKEDTFFVYQRV